ncbi:MAG: mevalonate kinase [Hadesarchaea archaeon]|nr:mevalonate kinase [Hadesarchaea archaeon]
MITVSSPAQIFFFGEHAVVYGQPALATAINLRTKVKGKSRDDNKVIVKSHGIGSLEGVIECEDNKWVLKEKKGDTKNLSYVIKAIEVTLNQVEEGGGFELEITSDIPPGSGLGSSSAVTTATIAAVSNLMNNSLDKDMITDLAFETEKLVQGPASRTGVSVATHGSFALIQDEEIDVREDLPQLNIVIGYTGSHGSTAEAVGRVKELKNTRPNITNPILETIGEITQNGMKAVKEGDLDKVGVLMNANQALLKGLDVSSDHLESLIKAAHEAGAKGAKLTGGGKGGSMIAIIDEKQQKIVKAIREANGKPIEAEIGVNGLELI